MNLRNRLTKKRQISVNAPAESFVENLSLAPGKQMRIQSLDIDSKIEMSQIKGHIKEHQLSN
jgi:hypothetical protein